MDSKKPTSKALITLIKIMPHINIIISGVYITFYIIDLKNSAMAFINNPVTKFLILVLALCSVVSSIFLIVYQRNSL